MKEFNTEVKRFPLPMPVTQDCPECGETVTYSTETNNYLSYPVANRIEPFGMYCAECEHEWEIDIMLNVSLDIISK